MGMVFSVRGTLSPFVGRRRVPVHAETVLFKCQCEYRPRSAWPPPSPSTRILKCHSPHDAINFAFVYHDSDTNRSIESIVLFFSLVNYVYCYLFVLLTLCEIASKLTTSTANDIRILYSNLM